MRDRARLFAFGAAAASVAVLGLTIASAVRPNLVTVALVFATMWAASISVADAVMLRRRQPIQLSPRGAPEVTFVMSLGEERPDIARTSILLAAESGAVHVVSTRHHDVLDQLGDVSVTEHIAPTIQQALDAAASEIKSYAVMLISASAFPIAVSCAAAAAELGGDVAWVIGSAAVFNHDRYAPRERDALSVRVRSAARRLGLVAWEPDATLVRTAPAPRTPARSVAAVRALAARAIA